MMYYSLLSLAVEALVFSESDFASEKNILDKIAESILEVQTTSAVRLSDKGLNSEA